MTGVLDRKFCEWRARLKIYDIDSLSNAEFISNNSIFLSINIQSLQSKYDQLLFELNQMESKGINVDILALQEVWDIRYPDLLSIPGFKPLIFKKRHGMRGGGVGFDVCSHSILLKKLAKIGITGVTHRWFSDYLSGRSQKVEISGKLSESQNLDISVIQGSTLGPLLFLCYINDFFTATTLFSVLFADDTTCLSKGKKLDELVRYVNQELQKIALWFKANKMAVNTSKTKYIVFRTQGKHVNNDMCRLVFNNNVPGSPEDPNLISQIDRMYNEGPVSSFKLLGVLFDEFLSFNQHISHVCAKISKSLFCINKIKNFVDKNALKMLYYAMIHSHLSYCLNVYSCANTTTLQRLRVKQKEAIRVVLLHLDQHFIERGPYRSGRERTLEIGGRGRNSNCVIYPICCVSINKAPGL